MVTRVLLAAGEALTPGQTTPAGLGAAAVSGQQLTVKGATASDRPLVVVAAASISVDMFRVEDSTGTMVMGVDQFGQTRANRISHTSGAGAHVWMTGGSVIADNPSATSLTPFVVKGISGQTARLQEWQDSGFVMVAGVEADGKLKFVAANEATTVGAAGGASALPATPTKYFLVKDSAGTTLKIPAYAS